MKDFILKYMPICFQNLLISIYNSYQYKIRHGGRYVEFFDFYADLHNTKYSDVINEQNERLNKFLNFSTKNSEWYSNVVNSNSLKDFPVLTKEDLVNNLKKIATISERKGIISFTGGTTGASMKVIYTKSDMQERFAILDVFRASYGYKLGSKVAWFSGKSLVTKNNLAKGLCYRDDWINKIRFFSTFHITQKYFDDYWVALHKFSPEYIVGFSSSVFDICSIAEERGLKYTGNIKVFFPTAETVLPMHRDLITKVLGCVLVDQYASSEGAPFILECKYGIKHIHPLTGIFEVVDENFNPAQSGELLVTSFTTHGTPIIRYKIGDRITLGEAGLSCQCGSEFPIVNSIDGRSADYILSPENGKVNLGNLSNATKGISGLLCFQLIQNETDLVIVNVVVNNKFDLNQEVRFEEALRMRLGESMIINLNKVDNIPTEKSGKFRIVKNNLKHQ